MNQAYIFANYLVDSNLHNVDSLLHRHNIYTQNKAQKVEALVELLQNKNTFNEVIAIHPDKELFEYTAPIQEHSISYSRIDGNQSPAPTPVLSDPQKLERESNNSIKIEIPAWLLLVAFLWLMYKLLTLFTTKFKTNE